MGGIIMTQWKVGPPIPIKEFEWEIIGTNSYQVNGEPFGRKSIPARFPGVNSP